MNFREISLARAINPCRAEDIINFEYLTLKEIDHLYDFIYNGRISEVSIKLITDDDLIIPCHGKVIFSKIQTLSSPRICTFNLYFNEIGTDIKKIKNQINSNEQILVKLVFKIKAGYKFVTKTDWFRIFNIDSLSLIEGTYGSAINFKVQSRNMNYLLNFK